MKPAQEIFTNNLRRMENQSFAKVVFDVLRNNDINWDKALDIIYEHMPEYSQKYTTEDLKKLVDSFEEIRFICKKCGLPSKGSAWEHIFSDHEDDELYVMCKKCSISLDGVTLSELEE